MQIPIVNAVQIVKAATTAKSVTIDNPYGHDCLLVHSITGSPVTGGYCTLSQSPDGVLKIAHQGGTDAVGVKIAASTTSYTALYKNVISKVIVDLTVTDGTHDVWAYFINRA